VTGVNGGGGRSGKWFGRIVLGGFRGGVDGECGNLGSGNGELFHGSDMVLVVQEIRCQNEC